MKCLKRLDKVDEICYSLQLSFLRVLGFVFLCFTLSDRVCLHFFSRIVQLCNRGHQLMTGPNQYTLTLYSSWPCWLRVVVSHFMWMKKNKFCTWSDCSRPKLLHRCFRLWFRKMFWRWIFRCFWSNSHLVATWYDAKGTNFF